MRTVTRLLIKMLSHPKIPRFIKESYKYKPDFWNYALIGMIGVLINQITIHFFIKYLPLIFANFLSIGIAWMWNYQNALGSLSKYWK